MRYRFPQSFHRKIRQGFRDKAAVSRAAQKLLHGALRRPGNLAVFFQPFLIRQPLVFLLEANARQHIVGLKIRCAHIAEDTAVGGAAVPLAVAHSVHTKFLFPGGADDDFAAGAHAEGIDPSAVGGAVRYFVVRRGKPPLLSVLGPVDQGLRVFHSNSDGKRLLLHRQFFLMNHFEGIPGAVTDCQNHRIGDKLFPVSFIVHQHRADEPALFCLKGLQTGSEPHFTAQGKDFVANIYNHFPKHIGADMRAVFVQNRRVGAGLRKDLQHFPNVPVLNSAGELSVRKSPGAPFSEQHVGFRIQQSLLPKGFHIRHPFLHGLSSLNDHRPVSLLRQFQGGKNPAGPEAHDQRSALKLLGSGYRFCRSFLPHFLKVFVLTPNGFSGKKIHRIDQTDVRLVPGIDRLPTDVVFLNHIRRNSQHLPDSPRDSVLGFSDG